MALQLPEGYRFCPSDIELLLFYLRRKVLGMPLPKRCPIMERNLYGTEDPTEIFKTIPYNAFTGDDLYFFTLVKNKFLHGKRMERVVVGRGAWKMQNSEVVEVYDYEKKMNRVIGYKKILNFVGDDGRERESWIMYEYTLKSSEFDETRMAVCRIKRGRSSCGVNGVNVSSSSSSGEVQQVDDDDEDDDDQWFDRDSESWTDPPQATSRAPPPSVQRIDDHDEVQCIDRHSNPWALPPPPPPLLATSRAPPPTTTLPSVQEFDDDDEVQCFNSSSKTSALPPPPPSLATSTTPPPPSVQQIEDEDDDRCFDGHWAMPPEETAPTLAATPASASATFTNGGNKYGFDRDSKSWAPPPPPPSPITIDLISSVDKYGFDRDSKSWAVLPPPPRTTAIDFTSSVDKYGFHRDSKSCAVPPPPPPLTTRDFITSVGTYKDHHTEQQIDNDDDDNVVYYNPWADKFRKAYIEFF